MLQARALQSRPTARHRYSLKPAQLQTKQPCHALSMSPSLNGPRLHGYNGQPPDQANMNISMSHSQGNISPPSTGLPSSPAGQDQQHRSSLYESQDNHSAARVPAQNTRPNQVCCAVGQGIMPNTHPPEQGGQTHHPSWQPKEHLLDHPSDHTAQLVKGFDPPKPQPFDPNTSDPSPSVCWPKPASQSVLPCSSHQLSPSLTRSRHIAQLPNSRPDVQQKEVHSQTTRQASQLTPFSQALQPQQQDNRVRDAGQWVAAKGAKLQSSRQPSPELGSKQLPARNACSNSATLPQLRVRRQKDP